MNFISQAFNRYAPGLVYGAAVALGFKGVEVAVDRIKEKMEKRRASKETVSSKARQAA